MKLIPLILMALLSGCAGTVVKDVEVAKVPIAVSCIDQLPQAPTLLTDSQIKALDDYQTTLTLIDDRIKRIIYESKLEAVLQGCK